jgi:YD repeat-containing protein
MIRNEYLLLTLLTANAFALEELLVPSKSEEIAEALGYQKIEGLISPITGHLVLDMTDFKEGDLVWHRHYHPRNLFHTGSFDVAPQALKKTVSADWTMFRDLELKVDGNRVIVAWEKGVNLEFVDGVLQGKGYSNFNGSSVSGRWDLRNIQIEMGDQVTLRLPDSKIRRYGRVGDVYRLEKVELGNGHWIDLEYGAGVTWIARDEKGELGRISAVENEGGVSWSSATGVSGSYGVTEIMKLYRDGGKKKRVLRQVKGASTPNYRHESISYNEMGLVSGIDRKEGPVQISYGMNGEVTALSMPVGGAWQGRVKVVHEAPIAGLKKGWTLLQYEGAEVAYVVNEDLLVEEIKENGRSVKRFIWTDGRLSRMEEEGKVTEYEYDERGNPIVERLSGDLSGDGTVMSRTVRRKFNERDLLVREESEETGVVEREYVSGTDLLAKERICQGGKEVLVREWVYEGSRCVAELERSGKESYRRDFIWGEKRIEGRREGGQEWRYEYDAMGNVVRETMGEWSVERSFNERGEKLKEVGPFEEEHWRWDERGRLVEHRKGEDVISFQYGPGGEILSKNENGHAFFFQYDGRGRLVGESDYLGNWTRYRLDGLSEERLQTVFPDGGVLRVEGNEVVRPLGGRETIRRNAYGSPVEVTYGDGTQRIYRYRKDGKLESEVDREGRKTEYRYDLFGRLIEKKRGLRSEVFLYTPFHLVSHVDLEGNKTTYAYDDQGRLIREKKGEIEFVYEYDPLGRRSAVRLGDLTLPLEEEMSGAEILQAIREGEKMTEERVIEDRFGRPVRREKGAAWEAISYEEKGVLTKRTVMSSGLEKVEVTNWRGDLVEKYEVAEGRRLREEKRAYDQEGNLLSIDGGQSLRFEYDQEGRLLAKIGNDGRVTQYLYSPEGRKIKEVFPTGEELQWGYDEFGFCSSLRSSDGKIDHKFSYSPMGRLLMAEDKIEKITVKREINAWGEVTKEKVNGLTLRKGYDGQGRVISLGLPDGYEIGYEYEGLLPRSVSYRTFQHSFDLYNEEGLVLKEGPFTYEYDQLMRKVAIRSPYFEEEIGYDEENRIVSQGKTSFAYDLLSQVIWENGVGYGYDEWQNVNEIGHLKLRSDGEYDQNSHMTLGRYDYDVLGRLIYDRFSDTKITYDPLGRRFQKGKEHFVYDGTKEIGSYTKGGSPIAVRIPDQKGRPVAIQLKGNIYQAVLDVRGNVRVLVDGETPLQMYEYTALGSERTPIRTSPFNPWRYGAERFDPDLGLIYQGGRYYSPTLACWLN